MTRPPFRLFTTVPLWLHSVLAGHYFTHALSNLTCVLINQRCAWIPYVHIYVLHRNCNA